MMDVNGFSEPEKIVYAFLVQNGIPFDAQEKMFGGVLEVGGSVVDFILDEYMLALRVMGTYWHSSVEARSRDREGKERLMGLGYMVVDLWEDKLLENPEYVITQALQGVEIPSG